MEKAFAKIEELADTLKEYADTLIESVKIDIVEKSSDVIANVMAGILIAIVSFSFIVFASMALSFGLGVWIGKTWAGFLLVACLYLLIGIVMWAARGRLIRLPIINTLIQKLFKKSEKYEED